MTRRLLSCAFVIALAGCTTPSFPVPPPEPDAVSFALNDATGEATFMADAPDDNRWAFARVSVFNLDASDGVITVADENGAVAETRPFIGVDGDRIEITYEIDIQISKLCLFLHEGRASEADDCNN